MDRRFHFISGLPRSGSTLLAAILRQNPRFTANISSPVASMFMSLQQLMSGKSEFHALVSDAKRRQVLKGVIESYYGDVAPGVTVFDTNRSWSAKLSSLLELFPEARIVCCVRPLSWVFDSFERLIRRNALEPSRMFGFSAGGNVYSRIQVLNEPRRGVVGTAFSSLREAFYGEFARSLILLEYESLCRNPAGSIAALYRLLGEEPFPHDFEDVRFESPEFDRRLGTRGLHQVGARVRWSDRATILPPDIFRRFEDTAFWRQKGPCQVTVI
jgi:sulfotransferase